MRFQVRQIQAMKRLSLAATLLLIPLLARAQLAVTVSPPKIAGSKAVVPLAMKNGLKEKVESARAVVFLLDNQGNVTAQSTKWVIGGSSSAKAPTGLAPGATNTFYFTITGDKPFATTNLTVKVQFTRIILESSIADPSRDVRIEQPSK